MLPLFPILGLALVHIKIWARHLCTRSQLHALYATERSHSYRTVPSSGKRECYSKSVFTVSCRRRFMPNPFRGTPALLLLRVTSGSQSVQSNTYICFGSSATLRAYHA